MKTRYTSLVSVKKNIMQKGERELQRVNINLKNAQQALEASFASLHDIPLPTSGQISDFLSTRSLLESQRNLIQYNEEWVQLCQKEREVAKEQLKLDMIEYEKFKYLDLQEIKEILKKQKIEEAKELDEVALMTYDNKRKLF